MRLIRIVALTAFVASLVGSGAKAIDLNPARLPDALVGTPYSFQLDADEGCPPSYRFSFSSGTLPPGLTISTTGLLAGTPTEAGTFQFFAEVADNCSPTRSQAQFTLIVAPQLIVQTSALKSALIGAPYTAKLTASGGGSQEWSLSAGSLPVGLVLAADGSISGTPTALGSSTFTVKVRDAVRAGTKQLTLAVVASLAATAPARAPSEVGAPFTAEPSATGGLAPYTWSIAGGALPPGLSLDPASGAVSGTPRAAGSFGVTLAIVDADGSSATVAVSLTVAPKLTIATRRLGGSKIGQAYSTRLATRGGVGTVRWKTAGGKLPTGIRLDTKTGALVGAARKAGVFSFSVNATDSLGVSATRAFSLTVRRAKS